MSQHIIDEAKRCLQCKNPMCSGGCPVKTAIPNMIKLFLDGNIEDAGKQLFTNNPLSLVCSYICPQELQCEGNCVLGKKGTPVQISAIENYISNYYLNIFEPPVSKKTNGKVAVIGSGPAGITIAFLLAAKDYDVTIFEGHDRIGGVLRYGIPEFRLPKSALDKLNEALIKSGVTIRPNTSIGSNLTIDDLQRDEFRAIFIGTGVWRPNKLGLKGESLGNVHFAIDYLRNPDVYKLGNSVAVIGAGNTAMDVARTAIRHGSRETTLVFNRGESDITARSVEREYARIDGAKMLFYKSAVELTSRGVILADCEILENGDVREIPNSEKLFEADSIILAVGQGPRAVIVSSTKGIDVTGQGLVAVDNCGRTTRPGVYASGDVVTGAKTVVEAVKVSRRVADAIDEYMQESKK